MQIQCSAGKGEMSHEECLACAASGNPPCGIDQAILKVMYQYYGAREGIHVTDITGCLKKSFLDKTSPQPIYPHSLAAIFVGLAVHNWIEDQEDEGSERVVEALGIVGRLDRLHEDGRLIDYKTTRWLNPANVPYGSHVDQVNIYAELLRQAGEEVTSAAIQYIDVSGPTKCRAHRVPYVPVNGELACPFCGKTTKNAHLGFLLVEVPLYPREQVIDMITARGGLLREALESGEAPPAETGFLCAYCPHLDVCEEGLNSF